MTGTEILSLVTGAYDVVKSVGLRIIDLFAMDKIDKTKALQLRHEYEMAVQDLAFKLTQAELWMAEKMMVGATWIRPLALGTGFAIIGVCAFNIVCRSVGWGTYSVEFASTEMLILLGMFIYVTSGSSRALAAVIEWLIEKRKVSDASGNNQTTK